MCVCACVCACVCLFSPKSNMKRKRTEMSAQMNVFYSVNTPEHPHITVCDLMGNLNYSAKLRTDP